MWWQKINSLFGFLGCEFLFNEQKYKQTFFRASFQTQPRKQRLRLLLYYGLLAKAKILSESRHKRKVKVTQCNSNPTLLWTS